MNARHTIRTTMATAAMLLASTMPGLALRAPVAPVAPAARIEPGQVMVQFAAGTSPAAAAAIVRRAGATVLDRIESLNVFLVRVAGGAGSERAAAAALRRLPGVTIAEANITGSVQAAPPPSRANDPLVKGIGTTFADRQWHLNRIAAPWAWTLHPRTYYSARTKPRGALKIAVIDTWIDVNHEDWKNAGGASSANASGGQLDLPDAVSMIPVKNQRGTLDWHGTHVAGIIGASTDNSLDIAGIAYSAQIMPVVVARGNGATNAFAVAKGITWAVDRGAKVINVSLALQNQKANEVSVLRAAVNRAVARGAVVVAAAGLVADRYRGISPADIARRIAQGADDLGAPGRDDETGAGRINAERALWPGGGPRVNWKSVPVAGEKKFDDVRAVAANYRGVTAAEVLVDGRARNTGVAARAYDGRWGGTSESLVARLDTSGLSEGPHEIHIRARDGKGVWGPAAAGVLIVDRTPPTLAGVTCYPAAAVYPDDTSASVHFAIGDTWSPAMSVKIVLLDPTFTPAVTMPFAALPGGTYGRPSWKEVEAANRGPLTPGAYRLIVTVRDMAGHEVWAESPCVVLATTRSVPSLNASNGPGGIPAVPTAIPTETPTPAGPMPSRYPTVPAATASPTQTPTVSPE